MPLHSVPPAEDVPRSDAPGGGQPSRAGRPPRERPSPAEVRLMESEYRARLRMAGLSVAVTDESEESDGSDGEATGEPLRRPPGRPATLPQRSPREEGGDVAQTLPLVLEGPRGPELGRGRPRRGAVSAPFSGMAPRQDLGSSAATHLAAAEATPLLDEANDDAWPSGGPDGTPSGPPQESGFVPPGAGAPPRVEPPPQIPGEFPVFPEIDSESALSDPPPDLDNWEMDVDAGPSGISLGMSERAGSRSLSEDFDMLCLGGSTDHDGDSFMLGVEGNSAQTGPVTDSDGDSAMTGTATDSDGDSFMSGTGSQESTPPTYRPYQPGRPREGPPRTAHFADEAPTRHHYDPEAPVCAGPPVSVEPERDDVQMSGTEDSESSGIVAFAPASGVADNIPLAGIDEACAMAMDVDEDASAPDNDVPRSPMDLSEEDLGTFSVPHEEEETATAPAAGCPAPVTGGKKTGVAAGGPRKGRATGAPKRAPTAGVQKRRAPAGRVNKNALAAHADEILAAAATRRPASTTAVVGENAPAAVAGGPAPTTGGHEDVETVGVAKTPEPSTTNVVGEAPPAPVTGGPAPETGEEDKEASAVGVRTRAQTAGIKKRAPTAGVHKRAAAATASGVNKKAVAAAGIEKVVAASSSAVGVGQECPPAPRAGITTAPATAVDEEVEQPTISASPPTIPPPTVPLSTVPPSIVPPPPPPPPSSSSSPTMSPPPPPKARPPVSQLPHSPPSPPPPAPLIQRSLTSPPTPSMVDHSDFEGIDDGKMANAGVPLMPAKNPFMPFRTQTPLERQVDWGTSYTQLSGRVGLMNLSVAAAEAVATPTTPTEEITRETTHAVNHETMAAQTAPPAPQLGMNPLIFAIAPGSRRLEEIERQRKRKEEAEKRRQAAEAKKQARLEAEAKERQEKARQEAERKTRLDKLNRKIPIEKVITALSPEWDAKVDAAMKASANKELAWSSTGQALTKRDFATLVPERSSARAPWLNDEVINAYLQAVTDYGLEQIGGRPGATRSLRSRDPNVVPRYHAFNSFFYTNLRDKGPAATGRWLSRAGMPGEKLLQVDHIFIPVNQSSHWTLIVLSPSSRRIEYFDSLAGSRAPFIRNIKLLLRHELKDKFIEDEWKFDETKSPVQENGYDCGVFTVTTAKMIMLGIDPMAYNQQDIPLQRRRMAAELINGGFTGDFAPRL